MPTIVFDDVRVREDHPRLLMNKDSLEAMRQRSGYRLTVTTLLKEDKVNLFRWQARESQA